MFAPSPTLMLFDLLVGVPSAPDAVGLEWDGGSNGTDADLGVFGRTLAGFLVGPTTDGTEEQQLAFATRSPRGRTTAADEDLDSSAGIEPWSSWSPWSTWVDPPALGITPAVSASTVPVVEADARTESPGEETSVRTAAPRVELTIGEMQPLAQTTDPTGIGAVVANAESGEPVESSSPLVPRTTVGEAQAVPTNEGRTPSPAATTAAAASVSDSSATDGSTTEDAPEVDEPGAGPADRDASGSVAIAGSTRTVDLGAEFTGGVTDADREASRPLVDVGPGRVTGAGAGESSPDSSGRPLPTLDGATRTTILRSDSRPVLARAADLGRRVTLRDAPATVLASAQASNAVSSEAISNSEPTVPGADALGADGYPPVQDRPLDVDEPRTSEPRMNRSGAQPTSAISTSSETGSGHFEGEDPAEEQGPDRHPSPAATAVGFHPSSTPPAMPMTAVPSTGHSLHHSARMAVADTIVRMGEDQLLASAAPKKAIVQLTPAHLGRVQIEVVQQPNRSVEVHLTTETREAHLALEADADDLVEHLRSHSIEVTKVDVKGDGDAGDPRSRDLNRERPTHDSNDPTRRDGRQGRHSSRRGDTHFTDYRYWEAIR